MIPLSTSFSLFFLVGWLVSVSPLIYFLVFCVCCFTYILYVGYSNLGSSLHLTTKATNDIPKLVGYLCLSSILRLVVLLQKDGALYRKFYYQACLVFFNVCFYIILTHVMKDFLFWLLSFALLYVFSSWLLFVAVIKRPRVSVLPKLAQTLESVVLPLENSIVESFILYGLSDGYLIVRMLHFTMVSSNWIELVASYRFWLFPFFAARVVVECMKLVYSSLVIAQLKVHEA